MDGLAQPLREIRYPTFILAPSIRRLETLITEAFRDPDWEHARGINTLQRVPFAIDPAILDLVDRFAVKVMGRSGKRHNSRSSGR